MITVVKIGGNIVDNPKALKQFIADFATLDTPKILVHGGGKEATRLCERLGVENKMIDGRRVTSAETLEVVAMVYAGLINKRIVSMLQAEGCNAIGLSGADANIITATKRKQEPIDFGFVGDIATDGVNVLTLKTLLDSGLTPVFCAITHDGNGTLLNCNADTIASAVATAASKIADTQLVYCFEQPGVMADVNDPESLISDINPSKYDDLKHKGVVNKGMLPKIDNAFKAINNGVRSVVIKHAQNLINEIGTTIHD